MLKEFEFYETLFLYNSAGKRNIHCGTDRNFTVTYKKMSNTEYEIGISDFVPENLKVEILPRTKIHGSNNEKCRIEILAPNKYKLTTQNFIDPGVFLKSTKFFKKVVIPLDVKFKKTFCLKFNDEILKSVNLGELFECRYEPFEGVVINCTIQFLCQKRASYRSYGYLITLKSKSHDLENKSGSKSLVSDYLDLEFVDEKRSAFTTCPDAESVITFVKSPSSQFSNTPSMTLSIYKRQKSMQEIMNDYGPTDFNIKSLDEKIIKVHKNILSIKSDIFKVLFETTNGNEMVANYNADIIYRAMAFIYEGAIEISGNEMGVYEFSEEYGLPDLKQKCLENLQKVDIRNPTYHSVYQFAVKNNVKSILEHFNKSGCYFSNQFQKTDKEALKTFSAAKTTGAGNEKDS